MLPCASVDGLQCEMDCSVRAMLVMIKAGTCNGGSALTMHQHSHRQRRKGSVGEMGTDEDSEPDRLDLEGGRLFILLVRSVYELGGTILLTLAFLPATLSELSPRDRSCVLIGRSILYFVI